VGAFISYQRNAAFIREEFDAVNVLHVFGELDISNSKDFESDVKSAEETLEPDKLL